MTCRQVETSSVLLFRRLCFDVMMWNFSLAQRWQNFEPLLYGRAWSITSHDIMIHLLSLKKDGTNTKIASNTKANKFHRAIEIRLGGSQ